jgi:O-methyltransferase
MKKKIKKILRYFGLEIQRIPKGGNVSFYIDMDRNIGYEFEKEANDAIKVVRKRTMLPYVNLLTLFEQVMYCEKLSLEGDFVECGVWKGGAVGLMAIANLRYGARRRKLHLFDAFEEICAPNKDLDGEIAINEVKKTLGKEALIEGEMKPLTGIYDRFGGPGDLDGCKFLIEESIKYPANFVHYHKGWFQDTIPVISKDIEKIAILRLDGDWYESTKVSLEYLYDKVVSNGIIIFDDYGLYSGCKKAVDDFLESRKECYYLHYSSWACRYLQKK